MKSKKQNEISHSNYLAENDTELLWGWNTPAGKLRASRRAELVCKGALLDASKKVLEIGCGTGMFTEIFSHTGATVYAADISRALLDKAEKRDLPKNKVFFINKPFEDCDVEGPFDAVIGSSILHHLDLSISLPKIFSLLKPGGILSFAEPNMLNPQVFLERTFRSLYPYVSPDETAFIKWPLKNQLLSAGFIDITITPFDWLHPAVPQSMIPSVSFIGKVLEKMPLLSNFAGSLYIRALKPY